MAQATVKKTNVRVLIDEEIWGNIASYRRHADLPDNSAALEAVLREFFKGWQFGPKAKG